ncbi:MAG: SIS domain-containing protein [Defluviitaleaceae bacterium]|nr:SIS domain-containing protein [Defluviitaleaceae bacterium]
MAKIIEMLDARGAVYSNILGNAAMHKEVQNLYHSILFALSLGGKLLLCGNGGSAADCLHITSEFVGRLTVDRGAWPALALCSDISVLTCLSNDYSYDDVFRRQIEAYGSKNDLLIALSTSGNSKNIVIAIQTAQALGIQNYLITGSKDGEASGIVDNILKIPSDNTQVIQEMTISLFHILIEALENEITE